MSRTLTQIYSSAVTTRNKYLQLTNLQASAVSTSKVSVLNLMTYIVSVMIYTYETILDSFEIAMLSIMNSRMVGTADYYLRVAKLFQYNEAMDVADEIEFNEDTLQMSYVTTDTTHQIITHAAYQKLTDDSDYDIMLKVCRTNDGGEEGICTPLTDTELTAFKNYIDAIKFVGSNIKCVSIPGDILYVNCIIYYDDTYITADQASSAVQEALIDYIEGLDYNNYVYFQAIIDAIQAVEHIKYVDGLSTVYIKSYDPDTKEYAEEKTQIRDIYRPTSGYLIFVDETDTDNPGASTLSSENCSTKAMALLSTANLKYVPQSSL